MTQVQVPIWEEVERRLEILVAARGYAIKILDEGGWLGVECDSEMVEKPPTGKKGHQKSLISLFCPRCKSVLLLEKDLPRVSATLESQAAWMAEILRKAR